MTLIRPEKPGDLDAIRKVNQAAFPTDAEARLVDSLRGAGALTLSLVAEEDGGIVGHIAFSPVTVTLDGRGGTAEGVGLAPMAVRPEAQRRGVGSRLVREGRARLAKSGHGFAVVLGHPDYYARFGFVPSARHGIRWEHPAPDEAFLVLPLRAGGLDGVRGVARYRPEFDAV